MWLKLKKHFGCYLQNVLLCASFCLLPVELICNLAHWLRTSHIKWELLSWRHQDLVTSRGLRMEYPSFSRRSPTGSSQQGTGSSQRKILAVFRFTVTITCLSNIFQNLTFHITLHFLYLRISVGATGRSLASTDCIELQHAHKNINWSYQKGLALWRQLEMINFD